MCSQVFVSEGVTLFARGRFRIGSTIETSHADRRDESILYAAIPITVARR